MERGGSPVRGQQLRCSQQQTGANYCTGNNEVHLDLGDKVAGSPIRILLCPHIKKAKQLDSTHTPQNNISIHSSIHPSIFLRLSEVGSR